ncbi:MAG: HEAT repeat domain-containing protein [Leptolyngbya sp. SIO4C5]|uniref:HEAT repeat domain-containing protein n=1 Tax=Sphaerothrix gracilis TaxID=3151835 RepID=UPI0013C271B6|nr:HEAT repeat domain-containing protein [Leptolyngbya sp. SIO4C5]
MYDDDLTTLDTDIDIDLDSPLDRMAPAGEEGPQYDPEQMLPLLSSSETPQRMLAARAFCELQDERAIPQLINLLSDPCPLVRVSAAYALGRNPSATAIASLIHQLNQDWNGYVRKGIVWALGNCHDPQSIEPLIAALKTDISAVRLWAASALAQAGDVGYDAALKALPPLIEALRRDPVAAVRSNCAWTIGQLCRELPSNVVYATAVDALIESFAEEEELGVREDARTALLKLGDTRGLQIIEELEQDGWFS